VTDKVTQINMILCNSLQSGADATRVRPPNFLILLYFAVHLSTTQTNRKC